MHWYRFSALATVVVKVQAAASAPGKLRELAPPVEMPPDPVWHLYAGGIACIVLVTVAVILVLRRRRPLPVVDPVPPQQTALTALQELECDPPEPKDFYTRLVDILRSYIDGRFGIHESDATASELLTALFKAGEFSVEQQRLLHDVVCESDLVKFAAFRPSPDAQSQALNACREFIVETAVEEQAHAL